MFVLHSKAGSQHILGLTVGPLGPLVEQTDKVISNFGYVSKTGFWYIQFTEGI